MVWAMVCDWWMVRKIRAEMTRVAGLARGNFFILFSAEIEMIFVNRIVQGVGDGCMVVTMFADLWHPAVDQKHGAGEIDLGRVSDLRPLREFRGSSPPPAVGAITCRSFAPGGVGAVAKS